MDLNYWNVSAKELVWDGPAAWVERFGIGPPGPVSVIDSEITRSTASTDYGPERVRETGRGSDSR
jgi:hypothetical protein